MRSVATLAVAASHEINNPLMALIASLELLERTQTPNAYGQARLSVALAAAWEIKEKVRQLGRITRLEHAVGSRLTCQARPRRAWGHRARAPWHVGLSSNREVPCRTGDPLTGGPRDRRNRPAWNTRSQLGGVWNKKPASQFVIRHPISRMEI